MTELEALDDLISAAKAGETCRVHIERMSAQAGLAEAGSIYGAAYQDDLNAARMVHKALLPDWTVRITATLEVPSEPYVHIFKMRRTEDDPVQSGRGSSTSLGRAYLLAVLDGYRWCPWSVSQ